MRMPNIAKWSGDDLLALRNAIREEIRRRATSEDGLTFAPCGKHGCTRLIAWCKTEHGNWIGLEQDPEGPFEIVEGAAVWVGADGKYAAHFRKGNCPQVSTTAGTPGDQLV